MVCEEAPQSYSYGSKSKMKTRFVGGVVTPAQPQYLYGLVDDRADAHDFQGTPPILGIAASVGGYKASHTVWHAANVLVMVAAIVAMCLLTDARFYCRHVGFKAPHPYLALLPLLDVTRQATQSTMLLVCINAAVCLLTDDRFKCRY